MHCVTRVVYNDFRTRYAILAPKEAHKAMKVIHTMSLVKVFYRVSRLVDFDLVVLMSS